MLLQQTRRELESRVRQLLSDSEVPEDFKQYLYSSPTYLVSTFEQYISQIETKQIEIVWSHKIDPEAAASIAQIYKMPTALTPQLVNLIENAIAEYNPAGSWRGYAWDLAWMSIRVGVEIPYGTIAFPCAIGEGFKSLACTFVPSMGCLVFGTLGEILGQP